MSGFQNPLQMNASTYQPFPYLSPQHLGGSSTWIDGITPSVGFPNSYTSTGIQQHGHVIYPVGFLQNSTAFPSHININNMQPESLPSHYSQWSPGGVMLQSAPSLGACLSLASPIVANPQLLHHNYQYPTEPLMTPTVGIGSQVVPALYGTSQQPAAVSLAHVNGSVQHQQTWLQQQQQGQEPNVQQQQDQDEHQQHVQQLQQQQKKEYLQQQKEQHLQHIQQQQEQHQQHMDQLQEQHQQRLQHQRDQQQREEQHQLQLQQQQKHQKQSQAPSEHLTQVSSSKDTEYHLSEDSNHNITERESEYPEFSTTIENKPGPFYIASAQAAPTSTYLQTLNHPRQNALPTNLPKSLNSSLQIESLASPVKTISQQHTLVTYDPDTCLTPSTNDDVPLALTEAKVEVQGSQNTPNSCASPTTLGSDMKHPDYNIVKPVYEKPKSKDHCIRCSKRVYPMERSGPIKEVVYHKNCFTCLKCGTILNLKNFHHNPNDAEDLSIFCVSHKPKGRTASCDANAVHIKSALSAPKLDKVNEQIRSDRQHSEVLARPSHFQPASRAFSSAREHFYYGMHATGNVKNDRSNLTKPRNQHNELQEPQQSQQEEQQQEDELPQERQLCQQEVQHHQKLQQRDHVHENEHERNTLHLESQQLHHQVQKQHSYEELLQQNIQLQQQIVENEKKLTNDLGNLTISKNEKRNMVVHKGVKETPSHNALVDDVFLSHDRNKITSVTESNSNQRDILSQKASVSSSRLSSSLIHQEISSKESLSDYLATHFRLDNHDALLQQKHNILNTGGAQIFFERKHVSSHSSRSTSPMQTQTGSRSTDDNESRRSSFSSNLSSKDSVEFGASATAYSGGQHVSTERSDRPSASQNSYNRDASSEKIASTRMIEKNKVNCDLQIKLEKTDVDRFLPKNERMRMDRPSQYS